MLLFFKYRNVNNNISNILHICTQCIERNRSFEVAQVHTMYWSATKIDAYSQEEMMTEQKQTI